LVDVVTSLANNGVADETVALMQSEISTAIPPVLPHPAQVKQRAPTLWAIIIFKLLKGIVLLLAAFAVYSVRDLNLQQELQRVLTDANVPIDGFLADSMNLLRHVSGNVMRLFVIGSVLYGVFSIVEGAGLMFRAAWAGWMAIAESAIFVPLEMWEAVRNFSFLVLVVLILNIGIVWYLYANRRRLFRAK
jgi:uncharacterized membrane protein (DUF2068 family)